MRVFCPSCQEPVTVSDELAGKATFCPLCKAAFTAPTLFSSSPPTPAPPAYSPPQISTSPPAPEPQYGSSSASAPTAPAPSSYVPPSPPAPVVYSQRYGYSFSPEILQWLAPVCLGLAALLTLFSWNGSYPGGFAAYTQSAWGAAFGGFSSDPVAEKVMGLNPDKPPEGETRLRDLVGWNPLMLLFLPLVFVAFALSVLVTVYPMLKIKPPPQLEPLLPFRMALVAVLSLFAIVLLTLQLLIGFGLENGLERKAKAAKVPLADNATTEEVTKHEIEQGLILGRYGVRHTTWLRFESLALAIAALSAAGTFAITRRTDRPHPRVEVMW